tara:strand:- start:1494 stop:2081 length:588 start_codon:yes stop_codon:yes gene_type:complete
MTNESEEKETILQAFIECKSSLIRYIRRYVGKRDDSEDIMQEAFLRTYHANEKNNIQFPKTYMFKTAKNLAVREKTKMAARLTDYIEDYSGPTFSTNESSAFDALDKKQNRELLISAFNALPPQCRRVTVLRLVHGMPLKDIAQELGITLSTTEKHIAKGLERCETYVRLHSGNAHTECDTATCDKRALGVSGID